MAEGLECLTERTNTGQQSVVFNLFNSNSGSFWFVQVWTQ